MSRWLRHRWVIAGAAVVLVLAIGAVSWAATSTTTAPSTTPAAPGPGLGGRHFFRDGAGPQGQDKTQRQEQRQQRRDATLKLIRDKMSPADQATFDKLLAQQKTQQDALEKAREDLQSTNTQIRQMADKYLGVTTSTTSPSTSG
jgi:hypothetical protein